MTERSEPTHHLSRTSHIQGAPRARSSIRDLGFVSVPSLANQVAALIVDAIRSGIFDLGQTLPSERELAVEIAVSRNILRDALDILKRYGVLEAQRGRTGGNVVVSLRGVAPLLAEVYDGPLEAMTDLHQVRRIVEREACRSAALRFTDEDRDALMALISQAELAIDDSDIYREYTVQFHVRVGALSGNPILAGVVRMIANRISVAASDTIVIPRSVREKVQGFLIDLVDAMHRGDLRRIDELVDFHINLVVEQLFMPSAAAS